MSTPRQSAHRLPRKKRSAPVVAEKPHAANALHAYVRAHLSWAQTLGYTDNTLESRAYALERFVAWCDARGIDAPTELSRAVLEAWQRHLYLHRKRDGQALSIRTQQTFLIALRAFCKWLARERHVLYNAAAELVLPRNPRTLPRALLTTAQIDTLMAQPDTDDVGGLRDRALLELLYGSGMRRMELAQLTLSDIDLHHGTVMIRQGKGRKDRFIPMGQRAVRWLDRYLIEARPALVVEQTEWTLFLTEYGEPYKTHQLSDMTRRYMLRAGLPQCACHALRHACATHMLENGADIRFIQAQLGHAKLTTTEIYTHVAIGKLKEVHAATHPASQTKAKQKQKKKSEAAVCNANGMNDLDALLAVLDEDAHADDDSEAVAADANKPRR